ncbi:MAG: YdcF family protein [Elusimicrobiota bacterium]
MFLFKKLLTPFLLPPGIFSVLALCMAVLRFRKDRKQALVWAGFALLIWGASITPIEDFALTKLEYAYLPPSELKADAVVLLGGGIREGAPEPFGIPELSCVSLERALVASRIYHRYKLPVIVTGGALFSSGSEAVAIKKQLISLGVPRENIFTEEFARDTRENAVFSKKICDEKGYTKIAIVTSAYHMRRAVWSFKNAGFKDAVPYPAAYKTSKLAKYYYVDFLPGSLEHLRIAMQECLGLVFYKISYRDN